LANVSEKKKEKEERGFDIDGRFYPIPESNKLLADNPDAADAIIKKARPAIRRGGVIFLVRSQNSILEGGGVNVA